jgi:hypothetical protein
MRKRMVVALVFAILSALTFGSPAMAHTEEDPCAAAEEGSGQSGFAEHHVVPLVGQESEHNPGEHQGLSPCVP